MKKKGKKIQNDDPEKAARISNSAERPALKTTEGQEKQNQQITPSRPHMLFR